MARGTGARRTLLQTLALFVLWLALSGHFDPLLLTLGGFSALAVALLTRRMNAADPAPPALLPGWRLLTYLPWLAVQVVRSNLDVVRRILHPRLPIEPAVIDARASQRTALGRAVYANSITLTPGTVSIDLEGDIIRVHALGQKQVAELRGGEMDRRITAAEGRP